jgi:hypothetical protein
MPIAAIIQAFSVAQQVYKAGQPVWDAIKGVLAAHGIQADTTELDAVILDAGRRQALAQAEADKPVPL